MKRNKLKMTICILVATVMVLSIVPTVRVAADETNLYEKRQYSGPKIIFDEKVGSGDPKAPPEGKGKPPKPPAVDKWAIVVGCADYPGWGNDLMYPDDDAYDMFDYLVSKGYPEDNIKLLVNGKAKSGNIIRAIDWMNKQEKKETSECVFFFSGHGTTYDGYDDGDSEYTDEGIVATDNIIILDGQLRAKFSTFTSKKIALIFDTCFSGGMDDLIGNYPTVTYEGRKVVTACGEDEYSWDGKSDLQNGVFSYFFIEKLYEYNNIEDAFIYAKPEAQDYVFWNYGATMNPQIYSTYTGEWEF